MSHCNPLLIEFCILQNTVNKNNIWSCDNCQHVCILHYNLFILHNFRANVTETTFCTLVLSTYVFKKHDVHNPKAINLKLNIPRYPSSCFCYQFLQNLFEIKNETYKLIFSVISTRIYFISIYRYTIKFKGLYIYRIDNICAICTFISKQKM